MYFFYVSLIIFFSFVSVFFLTRSLITLISFFTKSPFVPSDRMLITKGLEFLNVKRGDRFLDIGSGDGRVVFTCAKNYPGGEIYKGIETIGLLVIVAKFKKLFLGMKEEIVFEKKNALKYDYSTYNKVFMYLLPEFVAELMPKLEKQLPSKSIVVSIAFTIPEIYKKTGSLVIQEVKLGRKVKKIYIWKKD